MEESNYCIEDWYKVPASAINDPIVKHMMDERVAALDSARKTNKALHDYVLRNYEAIAQKSLPSLTKTQAQVLSYIVSEYCKNGRSPTAVEITVKFNCSSVNTAVYYINLLQRKGYVHKTKSKWRSIVPIYNAKKEKISKERIPEDEI